MDNFIIDNSIPLSLAENITNKRTFDRFFPSQALEPSIDGRPLSTKYDILAVVDVRPTQLSVDKSPVYPTYSLKTTFNPGDRNAPWSGFASNINVESELRNQIYGLQKCDSSVYAPPSSSELYNDAKFNVRNQPAQPYPGLFEPEALKGSIAPTSRRIPMPKSAMMNDTRSQIKEVL